MTWDTSETLPLLLDDGANRRPTNMVDHLLPQAAAHKLDSAATRVASLVRADRAIPLWLAVQLVSRRALVLRLELEVVHGSLYLLKSGIEV